MNPDISTLIIIIMLIYMLLLCTSKGVWRSSQRLPNRSQLPNVDVRQSLNWTRQRVVSEKREKKQGSIKSQVCGAKPSGVTPES